MSVSAIAIFNTKKIKGYVKFTENDNSVTINVNITGLKKNSLHGFHVHEFGDMSDSCESMCSHFNPYNKKHGGPDSTQRYIGDLGNLVTNKN